MPVMQSLVSSSAAVSSSVPSAASSSVSSLDQLALRAPALVHEVTPPPELQDWAIWLAEIGFLPGEPVSVIARGAPGGDPLVVRIGDSTFALRRAEAACVQVVPATESREAA
jgi:ferrous iron transport protein A